ncbi:MAG TPA: MFS transporter [Pseudonocardia sp.]|nr:MFS transporter [Pseudonocardia sp.]
MSTAPGWWSALGRERARPARLREWRHAGWLAVGTVCFGAFMGQLDASIVTLTYQPLRTQFHVSLAEVQWVSLAYLLALAALLIPVGRLADAHGRKLTYLYGFVVFTAASAACGLAPSLSVLVACRVLQALGAAMLQANSVALVTTSAPANRMRAALGVQAAAQALGLALGPTVGGLLVETLGWRWVFWINVPIGVLAVLGGIYLLPRTRERSGAGGRDLPGALLLATASTSLLLGISGVSGLPLPRWASVGLLAVAALASVGFVLRLRWAATPLIDLALLRNRDVAAGLLGALGGYLVLFGPLVLVPVTFGDAGRSQLQAGFVLTALPAGFALAATVGDRLLPRHWTERTRAILGAGLSVLALAGLLTAPPATDWLIAPLALLGLALGLFTPANNTLIMATVPGPAAATGGGLVNMARSLGTALGVAVVALALSVAAGRHGPPDGPTLTVLVLAATSVVTLCSAWAQHDHSAERAVSSD